MNVTINAPTIMVLSAGDANVNARPDFRVVIIGTRRFAGDRPLGRCRAPYEMMAGNIMAVAGGQRPIRARIGYQESGN